MTAILSKGKSGLATKLVVGNIDEQKRIVGIDPLAINAVMDAARTISSNCSKLAGKDAEVNNRR